MPLVKERERVRYAVRSVFADRYCTGICYLRLLVRTHAGARATCAKCVSSSCCSGVCRTKRGWRPKQAKRRWSVDSVQSLRRRLPTRSSRVRRQSVRVSTARPVSTGSWGKRGYARVVVYVSGHRSRLTLCVCMRQSVGRWHVDAHSVANEAVEVSELHKLQQLRVGDPHCSQCRSSPEYGDAKRVAERTEERRRTREAEAEATGGRRGSQDLLPFCSASTEADTEAGGVRCRVYIYPHIHPSCAAYKNKGRGRTSSWCARPDGTSRLRSQLLSVSHPARVRQDARRGRVGGRVLLLQRRWRAH